MKNLFYFIACIVFLSGSVSFGNQIVQATPYIYSNLSRLNSGDTLVLPAGNYICNNRLGLTSKNNIAIISRDGPGKAVIAGTGSATTMETLVFEKCSSVVLDGVEIKESGDNIVKFGGCDNVLVKNCYFHNAYGQGDCIKITRAGDVLLYSTNVTIVGTIVHTPGMNTGVPGSEYEENIDFMYTYGAIVKDCWLFHDGILGSQLTYPKGDCKDMVYDRCLFGPVSDDAVDPAVGGGVAGVTSGYNVERETIRNCLFVNCPSGAIGSFGTKDYYIYNNTIVNCGHRTRFSPMYQGIIHIKHGGGAAVNSDNLNIYNNIFYNNQGINVYIFCTQGVLATNVQHDYNAYYNQGASILTTADYNPADETARVTSNPYPGTAPALPAITITPTTTWAQLDSLKRVIIALYRISASSPVVNNGIDAGTLPYPGVVDDIEGGARAAGSYDIGAYEYSNIATEAAAVPVEMEMISATPNPFNPAVVFTAGSLRTTSLRIYDVNGRMIADLTSSIKNGLITWNTGTNPVGVYVVNARIDGKNYTKRITLLR